MSKMRPLLIVVAGPTAIGKTKVAIELAQHYQTEIVSADSRQFYKEMSVGTAKPTEEELSSAPHHFVGFLSVEEKFSAGEFERAALKKLEEIFSTRKTAILVGGSGLYLDAVCRGLDELPKSEKVRKQLNTALKESGMEPLREKLAELDPEFHSRMDLKNPQRLIRALEVCIVSGKPYSQFRKGEPKKRPFDILKIALHTDREKLYLRINERVDQMVESGLIEEAKSLFPKKDLNALNTVGYKELFRWLDGESTLEDAIEEIKKNTRRFAKRQLTWLRKDESYHWVDTENYTAVFPLIDKRIKALEKNSS